MGAPWRSGRPEQGGRQPPGPPTAGPGASTPARHMHFPDSTQGSQTTLALRKSKTITDIHSPLPTTSWQTSSQFQEGHYEEPYMAPPARSPRRSTTSSARFSSKGDCWCCAASRCYGRLHGRRQVGHRLAHARCQPPRPLLWRQPPLQLLDERHVRPEFLCSDSRPCSA